MTLTVRSASVTGATTASRALTHSEMDANWAHLMARKVDIRDFGAAVNGTTDDTTAWASAITYIVGLGGGWITMPAGTSIASLITLQTGVYIRGEGTGVSIIKQKASTNGLFIVTQNFSTLLAAGTANSTDPHDFGIFNLTIDGNKASQAAAADQTLQNGLTTWGYRFILQDVMIQNCFGNGLRAEWGTGGDFPMEATVRNLRADTINRNGVSWNGPHDSHLSNIICVDSSQLTDNTYDGFVEGANGASHHSYIHAWMRSTATKFHRYAISAGGVGAMWNNAIGESGKTANIYISAAKQVFQNSSAYSARGGLNVHLRAGVNSFQGYLGPKVTGTTAVVGVTLGNAAGDNVSGCVIEVTAAEQDGGSVDFTNSQGHNFIIVRGTQTGGGSSYVGSPDSRDTVDIRMPSQVNFAVRPYGTGITAAGTLQSDATALFRGIRTHVVSSVAANSGVVLWTPLGGEEAMVSNLGANTLKIYPASGGQINLLGTNNPLSIGTGVTAYLQSSSATQWSAVIS